MQAPTISVIMPAYNAAQFLSAAIESILTQTFPNFEFIILDDGSTDDTRELIAHYAARDGRIRNCPNSTNLGATRTLNRGLALARALWVARMDADDISYPTRFERQLATAARHMGASWITCPFDVLTSSMIRGESCQADGGFAFNRKPFLSSFFSTTVLAPMAKSCLQPTLRDLLGATTKNIP